MRVSRDKATTLRHRLQLVNESTSKLMAAIKTINRKLTWRNPSCSKKQQTLLVLTRRAIRQELKLRSEHYKKVPLFQFTDTPIESDAQKISKNIPRYQHPNYTKDEE